MKYISTLFEEMEFGEKKRDTDTRLWNETFGGMRELFSESKRRKNLSENFRYINF